MEYYSTMQSNELRDDEISESLCYVNNQMQKGIIPFL